MNQIIPRRDLMLIADIGGTNARFALANPTKPGFQEEQVFRCADFGSVEQCIVHYLSLIHRAHPDVICLAGAGPVVGQRIAITNNHWTLDIGALQHTFPGSVIQLLNDFEAITYGIPQLGKQDFRAIGEFHALPFDQAHYMIAVLGPGTGLGIAGLRKHEELLIPIVGEGSHAGFAPENAVQHDILRFLRNKLGRVSSERLVSGSGLENIHNALRALGGHKPEALSAADIFSTAKAEPNSLAGQAVDTFFEIIGQIAGDLALTLGAHDGVFIGGGIVPRHADMIANSHFRRGYERKGRHSGLVTPIPTHLIVHPQPGLLGAGYVARQLASRHTTT